MTSREVFGPALRHNAARVIVAHNHPRGESEPSDADLIITDRPREAGKLLGIDLVDHVIVTQSNYRSLAG